MTSSETDHTALAPTAGAGPPATEPARPSAAYPLDRNVSLVDVLDRVLAGGVVVSGELTLSIADVDLVHISLRALLSSVSTLVAQAES